MFDRVKKGLYWDRAWTLVQGCTPVSPACDNCWSAEETHMRANHPTPKIRWNNIGMTTDGHFNGNIRLIRGNLDLPLKVKKPTVWAVWNDLFYEEVSADFITYAFEVMQECKQHIFLILTKRPQRIYPVLYGQEGAFYLGGGDFLPNVWLGTTVENQEQAEIRIPHLLKCLPFRLWLSLEPLLGHIALHRYLTRHICADCGGECLHYERPLDYKSNQVCPQCKSPYCEDAEPRVILWVICGCESGPNARPTSPDLIRRIRDDCIAHNVPFFLKQMNMDGKLVKLPELDGKKWQELPR